MNLEPNREYNEVVPSANVEVRLGELEGAGWTITKTIPLHHASVPKRGFRLYTGPATHIYYKQVPK